MRVLFLIALLAYASQGLGCCSGMPGIASSFNRSDVVFYGKHLGTKVGDYYSSNGRPAEFENFEVIRLYKGGSSFRLEDTSEKYIISVQSSCDKGCMSVCFEPNHYYLIYASANPYTGMLAIPSCTRQLEIEDEQFEVTWMSYPYTDFGKNEHTELLKLAQLNQPSEEQSFTTILDKQDKEILGMSCEITSLKSELFRYKLAVYSLFALLLLEVFWLRWTKKWRKA